MINIRNTKRDNAFLKVLFGKSFSYFIPLEIFHNDYNICPGNLLFSNWFGIIKASRPSIKPAFKNPFSGFASVLILIADKQNIHGNTGIVGKYKVC